MSLRVWWLVAIFTLAVGVSILIEEPSANPEAEARAAAPPASAAAQQAAPGRRG